MQVATATAAGAPVESTTEIKAAGCERDRRRGQQQRQVRRQPSELAAATAPVGGRRHPSFPNRPPAKPGPPGSSAERPPALPAPQRESAALGRLARTGRREKGPTGASETNEGPPHRAVAEQALTSNEIPLDLAQRFLTSVLRSDYPRSLSLADEILKIEPGNTLFLQYKAALAARIALDKKSGEDTDTENGSSEEEASREESDRGSGESSSEGSSSDEGDEEEEEEEASTVSEDDEQR